jgi:hypothetical protein
MRSRFSAACSLLTLIALFLVRKKRLTLYMMLDIYRQG